MTREPNDLITLENAGVRRDNRWLVRGIDLRMRAGEIVTIIGPNGAGKSTTAQLVVGTLRASEGRVLRQTGLRVGYVPQKLALDPSLPMSVRRFLDVPRRVGRAKAMAALARVSIAALSERSLASLSGGQMQRALLARALLV
ncbi:MAG: ATP-binding cassette domain-containing protein, partial [Candidatus Puniceispirillaceae bacterium]